MVNTVLRVLRDKLNEHFRNVVGVSDPNVVEFINSNNDDSLAFTNDKVTPFLINISEDRQFRNPDQYSGIVKNGIKTQANPEIRIELLVLFVSKFGNYDQGLQFLSHVIKFFQANRVFNPMNAPQLSDDHIEKLTVELVSIPLEEQNQVWHSLNTSYLPSVVYRIRLISYLDEISVEFVGEQVAESQINLTQKASK